MGRYINSEAVIVRLRGKVKVTSTPETEPDRLPLLLLNRLINEAEGSVEQDLSQRYAGPFVTVDNGPFANLPERPTREILRTLCELLATIRVLETDFGRGSGLDGMKYADACQKRYDIMVWGDEKKPGLLSLKKNSYNTFISPPLPGLQLNWQLAQVDTGFHGFFGKTGSEHNAASYAEEQINDPSENYWNGHLGNWK